jgi:threonine dehydrogenase-like Zn-dependent dehydrogenase
MQVDRPLVLGHEFSGVTEDGKRVPSNPAIPVEPVSNAV